MLTKIVDQITADQHGNIMWRVCTTMTEGDETFSKYHRSSVSPGASLDNAPEQVKVIAQATWTPETIKPFTEEVHAAIAEQVAAKATLEVQIAEVAAKQAELTKSSAASDAVKE